MNSVYTILSDFCNKNNIEITEEKLVGFERLCDFLLEYNSHTNLTAIRDSEGVAIKHFADSVCALAYDLIPENAKIIDIGCGAGFPGLPLLHMRHDLDMTFLDSTAKKLKFTLLATEKLGISANFLPYRAEEVAIKREYREQFDIAVSRAVASLPVLLEISLPFVKVGGTFIAYKAIGAAEELSESKNALLRLGGKFITIHEIELPKSSQGEILHHSLVIIKKIKPTPDIFPRRYAQIVKKPL